MSNQAKQKLQI